MRAFIVSKLVGLGIALGLLGAATPIVAAEPPSPEPFLAQRKAADFLPLAKTFLNANPQHEKAWQTAWDLYQMARVSGELKEARDARLRMVADYPESLPARHLLAEMTAKDYADVLKECFRHLDLESDPVALQRFIRGADLGFKQYGPEFGGNDVLLQLALATGGDRWGELIPRLKQPEAETVQIAMIAFDEKLSGKEKIIRLQDVEDSNIAKGYQRLLYAKLPPEEQAATDVAVIVARDLLEHEENFQAARLLARICPKLRTLEVLPEEYPELLYGWAHAEGALGNSKAAAEILQRLVKEAPKQVEGGNHPLVEPAAKLIPVFENFATNIAEQEKLIGEVVEALQKAPPELLEFKLDASKADSGNLFAYLRLDLKNDAVEIMVEHKGKVICALQTSDDLNRVYLQNYPQIRQYAKRSGYPTFEFDIKNLPDGLNRFTFQANMHTHAQGRLRRTLETLITSPQLSQADSRRQLTRIALAGGVVPAGVKTENGERVLTWIFTSVKEPELHSVEFHVNSENRLTSIRSDEGVTLHVHYGLAGQTQLAVPEWPSVPVEHLAEVKIEDFFRIGYQGAELVAKLVAEEEAEVAAKRDKELK